MIQKPNEDIKESKKTHEVRSTTYQLSKFHKFSAILSEKKLLLKICPISPEANVSPASYQIILTDQSLCEDLRVIFSNVQTIYEFCFQKRQNYEIEDNLIKIKYQIKFEENTINMVNILTLSPVYNKIQIHIITKKIIPLQNPYSHTFQVSQNKIMSDDKQEWRMIVLDTLPIHDKNNYQFTVKFKKNNANTIVGLIAEEATQAKTTYYQKLPYTHYQLKYGLMLTFGKEKAQIYKFEASYDRLENMIMKVVLNKRKGTVSYMIRKEGQEDKNYEQSLRSLENKRLFPYIDFYSANEEVQVFLE